MQVQKMKIADLVPAKYNPKTRTEAAKIRKLISSIEKIGLIYPVAVSKDKKVIDGHRRVAVAKAMGWEEIPVLITAGNSEEVYGSVNYTTRRITGTEKLQIYLEEPNAIDADDRRLYEMAEKHLGRQMLHKIVKTGGSVTTYRWCLEVGRYVDEKTPSFYSKVARWIMKHRDVRTIRSLMALKQPSNIIRKAIMQCKPIATSFSVAK